MRTTSKRRNINNKNVQTKKGLRRVRRRVKKRNDYYRDDDDDDDDTKSHKSAPIIAVKAAVDKSKQLIRRLKRKAGKKTKIGISEDHRDDNMLEKTAPLTSLSNRSKYPISPARRHTQIRRRRNKVDKGSRHILSSSLFFGNDGNGKYENDNTNESSSASVVTTGSSKRFVQKLKKTGERKLALSSTYSGRGNGTSTDTESSHTTATGYNQNSRRTDNMTSDNMNQKGITRLRRSSDMSRNESNDDDDTSQKSSIITISSRRSNKHSSSRCKKMRRKIKNKSCNLLDGDDDNDEIKNEQISEADKNTLLPVTLSSPPSSPSPVATKRTRESIPANKNASSAAGSRNNLSTGTQRVSLVQKNDILVTKESAVSNGIDESNKMKNGSNSQGNKIGARLMSGIGLRNDVNGFRKNRVLSRTPSTYRQFRNSSKCNISNNSVTNDSISNNTKIKLVQNLETKNALVSRTFVNKPSRFLTRTERRRRQREKGESDKRREFIKSSLIATIDRNNNGDDSGNNSDIIFGSKSSNLKIKGKPKRAKSLQTNDYYRKERSLQQEQRQRNKKGTLRLAPITRPGVPQHTKSMQ